MTYHRGMGHIPDPQRFVQAENATRSLAGLVGAGGPSVMPTMRHAHLLDRILDQGGTSSCVGCALSTAVYLRGAFLGYGLRRPSAKGIYDVARLVDRPGGSVFDTGCQPRAAMLGVQEYGMVAEERWPLFAPSDEEARAYAPDGTAASWIDALPPFDVFKEGADALLTGYYRADTGDIVLQLKRALVAGHFPLFAMHVRPDYQDVAGSEVYEASGPPDTGLPSHMQAICGYDEAAVDVVSSWGRGHGTAGIVRVSWDIVASAWSFGRMVVTAVPVTTR